MSSIKASEIKDVMNMLDKTRKDMSVCFLGPPGIGKTQGIYDWAKEHDRNVVTIIASQCLPSEVAGFVMPDSDGKHSTIYDPRRLADMKDGDILFFDELLTAPTSVLSACLTLIQERTMMSGRKLADVIIVAAANPLGSAAQIPLPIRQRFTFIGIDWSANEWSKYIRERYEIDVPDYIKRCIVVKGNSYNVLTPRSATKMIELVTKISSEDDKRSARLIIQHAFNDVNLTDSFLEIYDQMSKPKAEDLVIKSIGDLGLDKEREKKLVDLLSNAALQDFMNILREILCEDEMSRFEKILDKYDKNDFR